MINPLISSFYIYKFAKDISSPYTNLNAYQAGLIDENGNMTGQESSMDSYEYLVLKLKKIFEELPGNLTKAALTNYYTTLQMFTEECSWYGIDPKEMSLFLEGYISGLTNGETSYVELMEDMAVGGGGGGAGSLGTPAIAPGANQGNVSGYDPVMGKMQRRKEQLPSFLDNCEMFDLDDEEYNCFSKARAWKSVPPSPTKNYLKRFQSRNPESKLAVRNSNTGDVYWINYS